MSYNIYGNFDTINFDFITVVPIPVELVSFDAEFINNDVSLHWTTATETNNRGFEIQRSASEAQNSGWVDLGFVQGNGTSTLAYEYSYLDKGIIPGHYRYRLKQIDLDGSYEYSAETEIEITPPGKFSLEQNYPNPFNPLTTIEYSVPEAMTPSEKHLVILKVYDILGNETATLVNEQKSAGIYEVKFDGSRLPSGVYLYRLTTGKFSSAKKFLLVK